LLRTANEQLAPRIDKIMTINNYYQATRTGDKTSQKKIALQNSGKQHSSES
jgi:hypothetical protein